MEFQALAELFGFAVWIDGCAIAYRLRRLMLQSHSQTLFLLVLEVTFGFHEAQAGVADSDAYELAFLIGLLPQSVNLNPVYHIRQWRYDYRLRLLCVVT